MWNGLWVSTEINQHAQLATLEVVSVLVQGAIISRISWILVDLPLLKQESKITRAPIGSRTVSEERVVSPTAGGYPPRPPKKSNRVESLESDRPVQNVVHSRPAGACGYRV